MAAPDGFSARRPKQVFKITDTPFLESEDSLDRFITDFENATIPFSDWTHTAHIAMACCYIYKLKRSELLPTVRQNIKNYNVRGGGKNTDTSGYHETLTVLWLWVLTDFMDNLPEPKPRLSAVRKAVENYSGKRLYSEYYSYDVAKSVEARKRWVEPDLRVLPEDGCPWE